MDTVQDRINKLREERIAREKARIEKLRQLNLKKYNKEEKPAPNVSAKPDRSTLKPVHSAPVGKPKNFHPRVSMKPTIEPAKTTKVKSTSNLEKTQIKTVQAKVSNQTKPANQIPKPLPRKSLAPPSANTNPRQSVFDRLYQPKVTKNVEHKVPNETERKVKISQITQKPNSRPSMLPRKSLSAIATKSTNKSLNDQLEKLSQRKPLTEVERIKSNPEYLKKLLKNSELIVNRRQTVFEPKKIIPPVRRSISAVHLKKISKKELQNCFHKWSSIDNNLNKHHLKELTEDSPMKEDKIVSAIKSERKRVQFKTPMRNFNSPSLDELQDRLKKWLQKRGKSLDSYHHLHCFGIQYLSEKDAPKEQTPLAPLTLDRTPKYQEYDEENKENIAIESDSDDESFKDNMNNKYDLDSGIKDDFSVNRWRRASYVSDSIVDCNDSYDMTLICEEIGHHVDDLLLGVLQNLNDIIKEGYDWEQCAQWLRTIRERFPSAPNTAAYWECRAALEESRGNLPASVECWNEAIANGTQASVVEASLDQLLDKFMQLKISPSKKNQPVNPKMVDVKNVFKSTLIRFAVQQAKLRSSNKLDTPKVLVTPVRRSGRLSVRRTNCESERRDANVRHSVFVPNPTLVHTP